MTSTGNLSNQPTGIALLDAELVDHVAEQLRARRTGHDGGRACDALDPCGDCRAERAIVQESRVRARVPRQRLA